MRRAILIEQKNATNFFITICVDLTLTIRKLFTLSTTSETYIHRTGNSRSILSNQFIMYQRCC